jgi:peroxiredoxin family protein
MNIPGKGKNEMLEIVNLLVHTTAATAVSGIPVPENRRTWVHILHPCQKSDDVKIDACTTVTIMIEMQRTSLWRPGVCTQACTMLACLSQIVII